MLYIFDTHLAVLQSYFRLRLCHQMSWWPLSSETQCLSMCFMVHSFIRQGFHCLTTLVPLVFPFFIHSFLQSLAWAPLGAKVLVGCQTLKFFSKHFETLWIRKFIIQRFISGLVCNPRLSQVQSQYYSHIVRNVGLWGDPFGPPLNCCKSHKWSPWSFGSKVEQGCQVKIIHSWWLCPCIPFRHSSFCKQINQMFPYFGLIYFT